MRLVLTCVLGIILITLFSPSPAEAISRPGKADGRPTKISITAVLLDVDEINGADQSVVANFYFEARWQDTRLAHNEPDIVIRPLKEVWHPRFQFVNQQKIWSTLPEDVEISSGGEVLYRQRVWGAFSEPLELQEFPFDRQDFKIILVSSGYTPEEVKFLINPAGISGLASEFSQQEWNILEWRLDIAPFRVMEGDIPDTSFSFVFVGERKFGFYIWKVVIPLIFIVMMHGSSCGSIRNNSPPRLVSPPDINVNPDCLSPCHGGAVTQYLLSHPYQFFYNWIDPAGFFSPDSGSGTIAVLAGLSEKSYPGPKD